MSTEYNEYNFQTIVYDIYSVKIQRFQKTIFLNKDEN